MKSYRRLKEEIGLSTGAGIANFDPLLGGMRKRQSVSEMVGMCETCSGIMVYKHGKMICEKCPKEMDIK